MCRAVGMPRGILGTVIHHERDNFFFFLRRKGTTVKVRFYYFGGLISLAYGLGQSILWGLGMHRNKDYGILS